jgi:hypothetical protein
MANKRAHRMRWFLPIAEVQGETARNPECVEQSFHATIAPGEFSSFIDVSSIGIQVRFVEVPKRVPWAIPLTKLKSLEC